MELLAILVFYSYLGGWAESGLTTYAAYMLATSLCLSPWIFNPFSLTVDQVAITSCYTPLYSPPTPYTSFYLRLLLQLLSTRWRAPSWRGS